MFLYVYALNGFTYKMEKKLYNYMTIHLSVVQNAGFQSDSVACELGQGTTRPLCPALSIARLSCACEHTQCCLLKWTHHNISIAIQIFTDWSSI